MVSLSKPTSERIRRFLEAQRGESFTYDAVGATATEPPPGYVRGHTRVELGRGDAVFEAACEALRHWEQFQTGWLWPHPPDAPFEVGLDVAIVARSAFTWWLNACRIVDVIDEDQPTRRFGLAYGTLPDHAGSGEERFLIERDENGVVWYDVLAFSRPRHPLTKLAYPFMRFVQRRFGHDSAAAMRRAVLLRTTTAVETTPSTS